MDREFWLQRWQSKKPGFHQQKINSRLTRHWPGLGLKQGKVFVPLCGSTIDMNWLTGNGFQVLGVEFSEFACRKYFADNQLEFTESTNSRFTVFEGENIELWQGDFFAMEPQDLAGIKGVYDRASLIALPRQMRQQYVQHLSKLLEPQSQVLLISIDYDESKMQGPPFSVIEQEVRQLYSSDFDVEMVAGSSGPDVVGNLAKRGLDSLNEKIYVIQKK